MAKPTSTAAALQLNTARNAQRAKAAATEAARRLAYNHLLDRHDEQQEFQRGMHRFLDDFEELCFSTAPNHAHVNQRTRHHAADLILATRERLADECSALERLVQEVG